MLKITQVRVRRAIVLIQVRVRRAIVLIQVASLRSASDYGTPQQNKTDKTG